MQFRASGFLTEYEEMHFFLPFFCITIAINKMQNSLYYFIGEFFVLPLYKISETEQK